jgi:hypothetical protein
MSEEMTTKLTLQEMRKAGKPVSLTHLYRLFAVLEIKPLGRSRPQQYPADTAERILTHLGFSAAVNGAAGNGSHRSGRAAGKLLSVAQLRAAKPKTKGTK